MRPRLPHPAALAIGVAAVLAGTGAVAFLTARPVARASSAPPGVTAPTTTTPRAAATGTPYPAPSAPPTAARVDVLLVKEPNDYAHRNYCVAGATSVLLSAWMRPIPSIETVARAGHLDPSSGESGAAAVTATNDLLAPVTHPLVGHDVYIGTHATTLTQVEQAIRRDLLDPVVAARVGHPVPIMVQAMTRTMPGWHGWQATHMVTIYAADLSRGDSSIDTVTYAETPSPMAAYAGPPSQTTTLAQLWTAMAAFLADDPGDPVNLIAW